MAITDCLLTFDVFDGHNYWYFVIKIVPTYCEKKSSSDQEKNLKFKAEGREFAKNLRSLEQFLVTEHTGSSMYMEPLKK